MLTAQVFPLLASVWCDVEIWQADYGLLDKTIPDGASEADIKALINVDPRNNWRVHFLLEETHAKASPRGKHRIQQATPWYFHQPDSPQLRLPLWGEDLLP